MQTHVACKGLYVARTCMQIKMNLEYTRGVHIEPLRNLFNSSSGNEFKLNNGNKSLLLNW